MTKNPLIASAFLSTLLLGGTAIAQGPSDTAPVAQVAKKTAEKEHSINVSPLGLLVGSYSVNYERLFGGYHGLIAEGEFSRIAGVDSSSSNYGGNLGYRYHWRGKQDSGFVGINAGYATGTGRGKVDMKSYDVDTSVLRLTANIGRRWAWDSGLNITFRIGAGRGDYKVTSRSEDPEAKEVAEDIDELLTLFPVAFDGELSVGYAF